jgi:hypothetical protein
MADEHISDMLAERAVQALTTAFTGLTGFEAVTTIKAGKLQDSPVDEKHYLCVHIGDPEDPNFADSFYGARDPGIDRGFVTAAASQIGGGDTWWRRFTVECGLFGQKTKLTREEARRIANLTRGRIERAIAGAAGLRGVTDSLGEVSLLQKVVSSRATEGGGPPSSFIWRIKVQFQVLTERPF